VQIYVLRAPDSQVEPALAAPAIPSTDDDMGMVAISHAAIVLAPFNVVARRELAEAGVTQPAWPYIVLPAGCMVAAISAVVYLPITTRLADHLERSVFLPSLVTGFTFMVFALVNRALPVAMTLSRFSVLQARRLASFGCWTVTPRPSAAVVFVGHETRFPRDERIWG
jgi:hypothetical protein